MATTITEVLDEILTILRANLTDPYLHRIRKGENWIISKFPAYTPETPYIKLSFIGSDLEALAIGSAAYRQVALFQITIASREGEELDVDGDGVKETCSEIASYYANQVISLTNTSIESFTKPCIIRVVRQNRIIKKGVYYMTVDLKATLQVK